MCISFDYIYVYYKNDTQTLQCQVNPKGLSFPCEHFLLSIWEFQNFN